MLYELNDNEIILFQGDSITDGGRCRNYDQNHVMGHGYQYIVGAKLCADNLDKNIRIYNRGISGNRIADLYGRWKEDTLNLNPSILSILIGVNDAWFAYENNSGSDFIRYEKIYRLMLDEALDNNPSIKLVLMEPFVGNDFSDKIREDFFRGYIQQLQIVVKKLAKEYGAIFVPLQNMIDTSQKKSKQPLIWDGVHPTILGHELIARKWLKETKIV
jgi:lysophospholipase L1-like esterase